MKFQPHGLGEFKPDGCYLSGEKLVQYYHGGVL